MIILYVFLGSFAAAVGLSLLLGWLHTLANRTPHTQAIADETPAARLHTEAERWEDTFDLRHLEAALAVEIQVGKDLARLDTIQDTLHQGLHKVWTDLCTTLHLDPIDIEWAQLGELTFA